MKEIVGKNAQLNQGVKEIAGRHVIKRMYGKQKPKILPKVDQEKNVDGNTTG